MLRSSVLLLVLAGVLVVADRPRHVNLLLLLRLTAETVATVLLTIALDQVI